MFCARQRKQAARLRSSQLPPLNPGVRRLIQIAYNTSMSLIPCPECQGKVSDQAIACPHCGYPIQQAREVSQSEQSKTPFNENVHLASNNSVKNVEPPFQPEVLPSGKIKCSKCGETNDPSQDNCWDCYAPLYGKKEPGPVPNICPKCGAEIQHSGSRTCWNCFANLSSGNNPEPLIRTQSSSMNGFAITGMVLGIASVFFSFIGLIPILAVVLSGIGLGKARSYGKGRIQASIGLILGIVYFVVYLHQYGHL